MANEKKGLVDITTGTEVADANANGILDLSTAEVDQIKNIGATTISAAQWGYVGAMDQSVATTDTVAFDVITSDYAPFKATLTAGPLPGTVDQQQTTDNGGSGANSFWQSFTPGTDGFLVSVTVKGSSGAVSNVTMEIFDGEGDGGSLLYTKSGLTFADGVTNYVLDTPVAQTSGSKLTWKFSGASGLGTRVNLSGGYPGGISSGGAGIDAYFQTFESSVDNIVKVNSSAEFEAAVTDYDNSVSGLTADNVQDAIDEVVAGGGGDWERKTSPSTYLIPTTATDPIGATGQRMSKGWFADLDTTILTVNNAVSGDNDVGLNVTSTISADVDNLQGVLSKITASSALGAGKEIFGYMSDITGNAGDSTADYVSYGALYDANGGSSEGYAFAAGTNFDYLISTFSGDIEFKDYAPTIECKNFTALADGYNLTIKAGDGSLDVSAYDGGDLILNPGEGQNGGDDGSVKINYDKVVANIKTTIAAIASDIALQISDDAAFYDIQIAKYGTATTSSPSIMGSRGRGSKSSPSAVQSGDDLLQIIGTGYDGTDFEQAARIVIEVDNTPGAGDMPGSISFLTSADGSATPTKRLKIDSKGVISSSCGRIESTSIVNTATYNTLTTDRYIAADYTTTGTQAITIPSDQSVVGRVLTVTDTGNNSGTNNITITATGATIKGASNFVLNSNGDSVTIWCKSSTVWWVV